jgi:hypothetical protein
VSSSPSIVLSTERFRSGSLMPPVGRRASHSRDASDVHFEESFPVRSFPSYKGQRNFPGLWWSSTMGRHVGFESWLERDWLMLLDFDPQVVAVSAQPFWLCWNADEQRRTHAPDFSLVWLTARMW